MERNTPIIGIDIAKAGYDVAIQQREQTTIHQRHRTPEAAAAMIAAHAPHEAHIGMEYTGGMAVPLIAAIQAAVPNPHVHIVTETDSYAVRRLLNIRKKSDKLDAILIARAVALAMHPDPEIRQLTARVVQPWETLHAATTRRTTYRHWASIKQDIVRVKNRAKRAESPEHQSHLAQQLQLLQQQLASAEAHMLASAYQQEQLFLTIPGIGPTTAAIISAVMGDPHRFPDVDAWIAYAGLRPPYRNTSGGTKTTSVVTKRQAVVLHGALFMWGMQIAANPQNFHGWGHTYIRFAKQERKRAGMWCCTRKMLRTAWHMATTGTEFSPARTYPKGVPHQPVPKPLTKRQQEAAAMAATTTESERTA